MVDDGDVRGLVRLSRYAGERFDLVQAGGGNTSVKRADGTLLVKASGLALSEVTEERGYSVVRLDSVVALLTRRQELFELSPPERSRVLDESLQKAVANGARPSIEVYLHAVTRKWTLHTHPLAALRILVTDRWERTLRELFPDRPVGLVPYVSPGYDLAAAMLDRFEPLGGVPEVVFFQNHGLLIHGDEVEEVIHRNEEVLSRLETLGPDSGRTYRLTTELSAFFRDEWISYLSQNRVLYKVVRKHRSLLFVPPVSPDRQVYCGAGVLELPTLDRRYLEAYRQRYGEEPKVVLYKDHVFFRAPNVRKAREIEEVFTFYLLVLAGSKPKRVRTLDQREIRFLNGWDAEKYRQKI